MFFIVLFVTLAIWLIAQLVGVRRATGLRRLQLTWLLSGVAVFVIAGIISQVLSADSSNLAQSISDVALAAEIALPISMGIAILRFHLYEIDRIISRTLEYALLTATLAAVFIALVALASTVLQLLVAGRGGPVDPRRRRADRPGALPRTAASADLVETIDRTFEPAHLSRWIRPG